MESNLKFLENYEQINKCKKHELDLEFSCSCGELVCHSCINSHKQHENFNIMSKSAAKELQLLKENQNDLNHHLQCLDLSLESDEVIIKAIKVNTKVYFNQHLQIPVNVKKIQQQFKKQGIEKKIEIKEIQELQNTSKERTLKLVYFQNIINQNKKEFLNEYKELLKKYFPILNCPSQKNEKDISSIFINNEKEQMNFNNNSIKNELNLLKKEVSETAISSNQNNTRIVKSEIKDSVQFGDCLNYSECEEGLRELHLNNDLRNAIRKEKEDDENSDCNFSKDTIKLKEAEPKYQTFKTFNSKEHNRSSYNSQQSLERDQPNRFFNNNINSVSKVCVDCKIKYDVKPEEKTWRVRCVTCYKRNKELGILSNINFSHDN
jgi:hypothetical protein